MLTRGILPNAELAPGLHRAQDVIDWTRDDGAQGPNLTVERPV